jgi:heterodisulfide reductase subunit A
MSSNQGARQVGIFLCCCGKNIADFVNLQEISEWAKNKSDIKFVETVDLLCSPAGKSFVEKTVRDHMPDSVVVVACSPKMHEKTFREAVERGGLNMAYLQMANIREQAAWVTPDKKQATEKAKSLLAAAIHRSLLHQPLTQQFTDCKTDVVVIGGGIAGIEAALCAAASGRKVTIIERDISLGGSIIKTEEVAPAMECAPCMLAPRLAAVRENKNITVITNAEVKQVLGFFGNFTVTATKKARHITDACIGCEACFEVCPVSVKSSFHLGLGNRKAVYTAFPGSVPAAAVIDHENCKHFADGSCNACVGVCPFNAIDFNQEDVEVRVDAGSVILAVGTETPDISALPDLGYGSIADVYTMPEFERIASSNGPYGGEIRRRDGSIPSSIAVLHCAGSLNKSVLPYCSGICCVNACKAGDLSRKKVSGIKVYNIHDRLVFTSPEAEQYYHEQLHEGTTFIHSMDLTSVSIAQNSSQIKISGKDFNPIEVDMVILSTGCTKTSGVDDLSEMTQARLNNFGFFKPDHQFLHTTGTTIDGIYAVGSCAGPCDVGTATARARAAIGDISARLVAGRRIELELMPSRIDKEVCAGCKLCIPVCPYSAITFDIVNHRSIINEAICRGCGTCAATCPGGAITAIHFTNGQIEAEIKGVIHG